MSVSDQQLIQQFRESRDREFLDELLRRHLAYVRRIVFQMVLDNDAADDVTQDIFLRVVRGLETFEGRSSFSTWLYRITMNTVRSHLQKQGRIASRFEATLPDSIAGPVTASSPDGSALQAELTTEIETVLASLTPQLRAAIVLVCLHGKSSADAAEIENCSTKTMHWRVHEARRQLKQLLAEHLS